MKCKECQWASYEDPYDGKSDKPFCILQDLFTFVDPEKECEENCDGDIFVMQNAVKKQMSN